MTGGAHDPGDAGGQPRRGGLAPAQRRPQRADARGSPAVSVLAPPDRSVTWPRVLGVAGAVLLVAMGVHLVALVLLGGPVSGPVSLRKPATFAETGWLLCWSVAVVLPRLR